MRLKTKMKKRTFYALAGMSLCGAVVIASYFLFWKGDQGGALNSSLSPPAHSSESQSLRTAPSFELPDNSRTVHKLEDLKGQPVVLHFWASWCPPCLEEISKWVEVASTYQGRPIHWVAVSLDKNWTDALKVWTPQAGGGMFSPY